VVEKILCSLQKNHYLVIMIQESQNMDVLSIKSLIGKLQVHEEIVNKIQDDMGVQELFSKQEGSEYFHGDRGRRQRREKGRFGRGHDNLSRSTGRPYEANRLTDYTNNDNSKSRFDKTKVKCYDCQKISDHARDCWNPTRKVEENANLVVENEK